MLDRRMELLGQNGLVAADDDRERLAATFDRAAELYQRARPECPEELYDELLAVTDLSPGAHLLEVGSATGKATIPLARRGFRITCLEPGAALAAAARRKPDYRLRYPDTADGSRSPRPVVARDAVDVAVPPFAVAEMMAA